MTVYSWGPQLRIGKKAEALVALFLLQEGIVKTVLNRSDDPAFWPRGVDFETVLPDGEKCGLDVKCDRYTTGKAFLETESRREDGVAGCFLTSEAEAWFYYVQGWDRGYWLPLPALREFVLPLAHEWEWKPVKNAGRGHPYTSYGCLVPLARIVSSVPGVRVFDGVRHSVAEAGGDLN